MSSTREEWQRKFVGNDAAAKRTWHSPFCGRSSDNEARCSGKAEYVGQGSGAIKLGLNRCRIHVQCEPGGVESDAGGNGKDRAPSATSEAGMNADCRTDDRTIPAFGSHSTVTRVPTATCSYRSMTCSFSIRMQPFETDVPMDHGSVVP